MSAAPRGGLQNTDQVHRHVREMVRDGGTVGARREEALKEAPKNGRSAFGRVSRGSGKTGKFRLRRGGGLGSLSVDRLGKEMSSFPRERRRPSSRRSEKKQRERLLFARVAESPDETNARGGGFSAVVAARIGRSGAGVPREGASGGPAGPPRPSHFTRTGTRATSAAARAREGDSRDSISSHHWRRGGRSMIGVVSERREKKRRIDRPVARGSSASRSRAVAVRVRVASGSRRALGPGPRRVLGRPLGRL